MSGPPLIRLAVLTAAILLLAGLPATSALAQDDPSSAQYGAQIPDEGAGTASASDSGDEASGLEAQIAFLPFTGLDLLVFSGIALVLTGVGFALRRAAPDPSR